VYDKEQIKEEVMSRTTKTTQTRDSSPSNYKYDQSGYIVLNEPIRREAASGRFVTTKDQALDSKKK